ncbi:GDSL-type esterase/lipase family protein [Bacillus sp. MMSF_3353]|jgi:lysophospholipase L1-like esterase|uniref:GDSL-type esterase/lipase family protein n=1 Tax=Bacillus sp. MMSF_3353 TaxID=3047081 RepID=UPI00273E2647|nr:GDSL-type esterase/lipase family protein [Bacillus sp. MMSF_3353]
MFKKVCVCLLTGTIALSAAACVDGGGTKKSTESSQGTLHEKESKDSKYKSTFKDSLFFGDSMIEAISHYEILDEKNVLGSAGGATMFALDEVENVVKRKPEHIFMNFGSNDLLLPMDLEGKPIENPIKFSTDNYSKLIQKIREKLPNVKIHLLSVTPVTDEGVQKEPRYKNINEYNVKLKELAKAENVEYIDLSSIFENNKNLHDQDGVHFKVDYYKLLLEQLKGSVK